MLRAHQLLVERLDRGVGVQQAFQTGDGALPVGGCEVLAHIDAAQAHEVRAQALARRDRPRRVFLRQKGAAVQAQGALAIGADRRVARIGVDRLKRLRIDPAQLWVQAQAPFLQQQRFVGRAGGAAAARWW